MVKTYIEKILILAKTYPTISKKYKELVCTAGIKEDGSFIRLYPVPFRMLNDTKKYRKYQWIKAKVSRNTADTRKESYRLIDDYIENLDVIPTTDNWKLRLDKILEKNKLHTNLAEIIEGNNKNK